MAVNLNKVGLNLKRFVDINIQPRVAQGTIGTRDTAVLYTAEKSDLLPDMNIVINNLEEALAKFPAGTYPLTNRYLTTFFNNGGIKCRVITNRGYGSVSANELKKLDDTNIVVAFTYESTDIAKAYEYISSLADTMDNSSDVYGINEKILLCSYTKPTNEDMDATKHTNLAVKYGATQLGAEMAIAAYLTKIDVYKTNSVYDYAFTQETKDCFASDSDDIVGEALDNNINITSYLANSYRNLGGNCKDGADLTNTFVRIVLQQTLTDRLIALLASKIKDSSGIAQIYSTIASELENYKTCGYLTTDKIWTYDTLTVTHNGKSYTVIEKGTPLVSGYIIKVLPLTALTEDEKAKHSAPPIYVIIADQYGIRKITVNGEVI